MCRGVLLTTAVCGGDGSVRFFGEWFDWFVFLYFAFCYVVACACTQFTAYWLTGMSGESQ